MAQTNAISLSGALVASTATKTRNANSVCHLFKASFLPSPTSTKADFLAAQADFDGYAPKTIATWADPILFGQGYATLAPTQIYRWELDVNGVGNAIGGYFLVLSTGELFSYSVFDPAVNVSGPGMAVVTTPVVITPAGVVF